MDDPGVGSRSEGGSWRGGQLVGRSGSKRFSGCCWPWLQGALEHWNNEKGCMVNVSQGDDVFGSNLGYNRLILVNAC